jgi:hypothetical protein
MNKKEKPARRRKMSMFTKGRTVTFKMDGSKADAAQKSAWGKGKPFSLWMREAAEEKLAREGATA